MNQQDNAILPNADSTSIGIVYAWRVQHVQLIKFSMQTPIDVRHVLSDRSSIRANVIIAQTKHSMIQLDMCVLSVKLTAIWIVSQRPALRSVQVDLHSMLSVMAVNAQQTSPTQMAHNVLPATCPDTGTQLPRLA